MTCSFFDWVFFANENSPLLQNGCWKIASSLQHYNCIFQSCQRFANAHSYGLCPWHDFQIQLLKPYPAWQKSWKFFVAILGNFILQLTDWGNYFQAFNKYTLFMWKI